jgi:hypothetical protein
MTGEGIKPYPPFTFVSRSLSFYCARQLTNSLLPHRLARWPRFRAPHSPAALQAPSITFLSPPDPTTYLQPRFSFDHPSVRCRVGGLQLTVTTMACLNPSSAPSTDAIPPRSAPPLLNSDLPPIAPNLPPNLHVQRYYVSTVDPISPVHLSLSISTTARRSSESPLQLQ